MLTCNLDIWKWNKICSDFSLFGRSDFGISLYVCTHNVWFMKSEYLCLFFKQKCLDSRHYTKMSVTEQLFHNCYVWSSLVQNAWSIANSLKNIFSWNLRTSLRSERTWGWWQCLQRRKHQSIQKICPRQHKRWRWTLFLMFDIPSGLILSYLKWIQWTSEIRTFGFRHFQI